MKLMNKSLQQKKLNNLLYPNITELFLSQRLNSTNKNDDKINFAEQIARKNLESKNDYLDILSKYTQEPEVIPPSNDNEDNPSEEQD
jgi:hypothetical protein